MAGARRRRPRRPGDALLKRIGFAWLAAAAIVAALAGCGGGKKQETTPTTPGTPITAGRVYFLLHGKVQGVRRDVRVVTSLSGAEITALAKGPSKTERELGLSTALPRVLVWETCRASDVLACVDVGSVPRAALAQVVYTLTESSATRAVVVNGRRYTRKDFEDETPIILVESPLPFDTVKSPLHATGTANTFEATFQYDLVGPDGKLLKTHFVTATSGTGQRGTFDFTVAFSIDKSVPGELRVYEISAKDGSRIHEIHIPITLAK